MTAQGSPLTRLRRALAGGNLLAARTAAADLPHVDLDEAAALLLLIAREDPEKLDAAAVRFLGRACLERSFITLADTQLLMACLAAARALRRGVEGELDQVEAHAPIDHAPAAAEALSDEIGAEIQRRADGATQPGGRMNAKQLRGNQGNRARA